MKHCIGVNRALPRPSSGRRRPAVLLAAGLATVVAGCGTTGSAGFRGQLPVAVPATTSSPAAAPADQPGSPDAAPSSTRATSAPAVGTRSPAPATTAKAPSSVTASGHPPSPSATGHGATPDPSVSGLPSGFQPVSFSATSPRRWFVLGTVGTSPRLLVTADGGQSWRRASLPAGLAALPSGQDRSAVAFSDADRGLLAAGGSFWATRDGGRSWRTGGPANAEVLQVAAGPNAGYVLLRTAHGSFLLGRATAGTVDVRTVLGRGRLTATIPALGTSGDTVIVVSGNHLVRSTDGGRTFHDGPGPCQPDLGGTVTAAGTAVLAWCATGTEGVGYLSTDRGASFVRTGASGANSAASAPTGGGTGFAYDSGNGLRLTDLTGAGTAVRGGPERISWVGFSTPTDGFAIGNSGGPARLWRSVDGGRTWSTLGGH